MGIFNGLFGGKKKSSDLPPEVSQALEKIWRLMEDESLQNSMNHPLIKEQIIGGLDVDELPHGIGEFGRSGENPIPVNGALGELIYLSQLQTRDSSQRLLFHRLGSVESIDVYETVSIDGSKWDILFLSPYHPRKSRKAPAGYAITEPRTQVLIYGTNCRVKKFPYGLQAAIRETTKELIGVPLPPPEVRQVEEKIRYQRPQVHHDRVQTAVVNVEGFQI